MIISGSTQYKKWLVLFILVTLQVTLQSKQQSGDGSEQWNHLEIESKISSGQWELEHKISTATVI